MIIHGQFYDGIVGKPDLDDSLEHFGVKGMKWRRRKGKKKKNNLTKIEGKSIGGDVGKIVRKKIKEGRESESKRYNKDYNSSKSNYIRLIKFGNEHPEYGEGPREAMEKMNYDIAKAGDENARNYLNSFKKKKKK